MIHRVVVSIIIPTSIIFLAFLGNFIHVSFTQSSDSEESASPESSINTIVEDLDRLLSDLKSLENLEEELELPEYPITNIAEKLSRIILELKSLGTLEGDSDQQESSNTNIVQDLIRLLLEFKSLENLGESECLLSGLTGDTSGITKKGNLITGTNCDDKINGGKSNEIIYTLAGIDEAYAKDGNDIVYGGSGDDKLYGGNGDDIIMAGGGSNLLDGGPGSDVLISGLGNNLLVGGSGNDFLIGGSGSTIMYGAGGSNSFDCGIGPGIVLDYNPSNGDTVAGECNILNNMGTNIDSEIEIKPPG